MLVPILKNTHPYPGHLLSLCLLCFVLQRHTNDLFCSSPYIKCFHDKPVVTFYNIHKTVRRCIHVFSLFRSLSSKNSCEARFKHQFKITEDGMNSKKSLNSIFSTHSAVHWSKQLHR